MLYQQKTCEKLRSVVDLWRPCLRCKAMVRFSLPKAKTAFERCVVSSCKSLVSCSSCELGVVRFKLACFYSVEIEATRVLFLRESDNKNSEPRLCDRTL